MLWARDYGSGAMQVMDAGGGLLMVPSASQALWLVRARDGEVLEGVVEERTSEHREEGEGTGALEDLRGGPVLRTNEDDVHGKWFCQEVSRISGRAASRAGSSA